MYAYQLQKLGWTINISRSYVKRFENVTFIMKRNLDGQYFHKYQQNEQLSITSIQSTQKKKTQHMALQIQVLASVFTLEIELLRRFGCSWSCYFYDAVVLNKLKSQINEFTF